MWVVPGLLAACIFICPLGVVYPHQDQIPLRIADDGTGLGFAYQKLPSRPQMDKYYVVNGPDRLTVKTPPKRNLTSSGKRLVPFVFEPLPLGTIKPLGWMKDQMQLMADGLPGHLHRFYRLVKNGTWTGGDQEYSALNEAWPYWYNGVVALAYGLDDHELKGEVIRGTQHVFEQQFRDGWLGPEDEVHKRNFWGRYPFLLGTMQLVEAQGFDQSKDVLHGVHRFIHLMHSMLKNDNQGYVKHEKKGDVFDEQWGRARAADMVIFLQWLYEKDPRNNTKLIEESMIHFYEQSFDWTYWFRDDVFVKDDFDSYSPDPRGAIFPYIHGVNAGQGLKYGAVMRRLTHMDEYREATWRGTNYTFQYHGSSSGAIVGDEGLSGQLPYRGVELCSVVETLYSLTYNYQALGESYYADRAELAAYNALPVMVTPDWWAHQYIAQTNQPVASHIEHPPFWNVGPLGTTFGTEPNYPCCAVNFPQGLPKYLSASFVKNGANGIAHAFLMPAEVRTMLSGNNTIQIRCDTNYPFEHNLKYIVQATASLDFSFRIPSWVEMYSISINKQPETMMTSEHVHQASGMHTIPLSSRSSLIEIKFSTQPRIESRPNNTIAIHYGALLYALPVPATWTSHRPANYPDNEHGKQAPSEAKDWTIEPDPSFKWNIGIDPSTIRVDLPPENERDQPLPNPIWTINAISTRLSVMACEIPAWKLTEPPSKGGGYAPPPPPPLDIECAGKPFRVSLQPYGALKVHMAEFPIVDLKGLGLA